MKWPARVCQRWGGTCPAVTLGSTQPFSVFCRLKQTRMVGTRRSRLPAATRGSTLASLRWSPTSPELLPPMQWETSNASVSIRSAAQDCLLSAQPSAVHSPSGPGQCGPAETGKCLLLVNASGQRWRRVSGAGWGQRTGAAGPCDTSALDGAAFCAHAGASSSPPVPSVPRSDHLYPEHVC